GPAGGGDSRLRPRRAGSPPDLVRSDGGLVVPDVLRRPGYARPEGAPRGRARPRGGRDLGPGRRRRGPRLLGDDRHDPRHRLTGWIRLPRRLAIAEWLGVAECFAIAEYLAERSGECIARRIVL